jgi:hypothetical protein
MAVSFIKNNVDHYTGATFGCQKFHAKREAQFTPPILGTLLSFLATRQIFTGAGRVGRQIHWRSISEPPRTEAKVDFQLSQRADHIVNDIYQWVQFNRAIINARDEPLADYRKYRRLHLLIGDSNMSPFATALKVGTTACVLSLLEDGHLPRNLILNDAVQSTRDFADTPVDGGSGKRQIDRRWMCNGSFMNWPRNICVTKRGDGLAPGKLEFYPRGPRAKSSSLDRRSIGSEKWLLETFMQSEG